MRNFKKYREMYLSVKGVRKDFINLCKENNIACSESKISLFIRLYTGGGKKTRDKDFKIFKLWDSTLDLKENYNKIKESVKLSIDSLRVTMDSDNKNLVDYLKSNSQECKKATPKVEVVLSEKDLDLAIKNAQLIGISSKESLFIAIKAINREVFERASKALENISK